MRTKIKEIGVRKRPADLIYSLDETPPLPHLLGLGFQHVAVICPYLVMVALVAEAAKLPHAAAQSAISLAMIAVAFTTVLQSLRLGPVGSGYLCPPVVTAIYLPSSLAAAASIGISAVCGMVIFVSACEIALASLVNRTRKLFPAVVSGVVIMVVGLELGKMGEPIRCARPELSILCVRSLLRRGIRDRGTCLGSPSDRRADDLPADERHRVATPRYAQHRSRHTGGRARLPGRRLGVPGLAPHQRS